MPKKGEIVDKTGEIRKNKETLGGYEMKIVEYKGTDDIVIEFQDKHKAKVNVRYSNFKTGSVKNPYHPEIYGVGYYGQGKYTARGKDGKKTIAYNKWSGMLKRCYDDKYQNEKSTYKDCVVCEEWYNFQNFAKWFYENYYEVEGDWMCLDKDILIKGNKIYSPDTCIIVPNRINVLFTKSDAIRGKYPIGVHYRFKKVEQYEYHYLEVSCSIIENGRKKTKTLKTLPLNKPFQAFYCYKQFKEKYIKQVADEYKDLIPTKLYKALYRYEVEIND